MTSCAYCDSTNRVLECDVCGAAACPTHRVWGAHDAVICNPDPATWPGRGCYKPPAAEVADDSR